MNVHPRLSTSVSEKSRNSTSMKSITDFADTNSLRSEEMDSTDGCKSSVTGCFDSQSHTNSPLQQKKHHHQLLHDGNNGGDGDGVNSGLLLGGGSNFQASDGTGCRSSLDLMGFSTSMMYEPPLKTHMRVRVSNEISKRYKDLLVPIDNGMKIFDEIYDHKAVKAAHVRKWGPTTVRMVKNNTSEIVCAVWDDVVESPCHTFTIDEMKGTTTRQLYQLVPESDLIKIVIQCVDKGELGGSTTIPTNEVEMKSATAPIVDLEPTSPLSISRNSTTEGDRGARLRDFTAVLDDSGQHRVVPSVPILNGLSSSPSLGAYYSSHHGPSIIDRASSSSSSSGVFRCPFSGIAVDDSIFIRMKAHNEEQQQEAVIDKSLRRADDDRPSGVGRTSSTNNISRTVSSSQHHRSLSPPVSSPSAVARPPITSLSTACSIAHDTLGTNGDSPGGESVISKSDSCSGGRPSKSTMRIRITNDLSKRYKDLVVDIGHNFMLFDCVYDNSSVKAAHVRKWGADVVKQVKSKAAEIQCVLLDSSSVDRYVSKTFSVDDLKKTSTKDLIELAGQSDSVELVLQCSKKAPSIRRVPEHQHTHPEISLDSKRTCPRSASTGLGSTIPKIQSEPCITGSRRLGGRKMLPSRLNHMSISSLRNATFDTMTPSSSDVGKSTTSSTVGFAGKRRRSTSSLHDVNGMLTASISSMDTKISNHSKSSVDTAMLRKIAEEEETKRLSLNCVGVEQQGSESNLAAEQGGESGRQTQHEVQYGTLSKRISSANDIPILTDVGMVKAKEVTCEGNEVKLKGGEKFQGHRPLSSIDAAVPPEEPASPKESLSGESPSHTFELPRIPQSLSTSFLRSNGEAPVGLNDRGSDHRISPPNCGDRQKQIKEFLRLCRSKKGMEQRSQESLIKMSKGTNVKSAPAQGAQNAVFPHQPPEPASKKVASLYPNAIDSKEWTRNVNLQPEVSPAIPSTCPVPTQKTEIRASKTHADKINRFLQFSAKNEQKSNSANNTFGEGRDEGISTLQDSQAPSSLPSEVGLPTSLHTDRQWVKEPPVAEIAVFNVGSNHSLPMNPPGVSLSGDVVKEVFPYHIVVDENFQILQVGNSLSLLLDDEMLLGRRISDVLMVTGPIPIVGQWEWSELDKMKNKPVFMESVHVNPSTHQRAKIKGTIIELSKTPHRQVMFALFPNVKNLSELESMNLSMADLPLHSCQREAVLLGEHSKSEVKLTNHLDQLHRDLINSMEKQIEDRTNELATANQDLEEANSRLAMQSSRQLEHFACMSHEIRTPLNCIVGMSSLLLEDSEGPGMDPMHADSIRMINTSGELLKAVVDDVLDYAKLESGGFAVDIQETNLQDSLDSVVHSISQRVDEKKIRLRTHYSAKLPRVLETDSRRLQQVLFNLLGNAGKFSNVGSVIDLNVSLIEARKSTNDNESSTVDLIRFSVKDYGKGIDKKDFETIFEPFSQASKETQNVYGGTGLGLSITSKLVHRLGGTISVDSKIDQYAEFTVNLPMKGKHVDVQSIKTRLAETTMVVVEPNVQHDYTFTKYPVAEEPLVFSTDVQDLFCLSVIRCNSLEDAYTAISNTTDAVRKHHFALLIHETLYQPRSFQKLAKLLNYTNFTLMTHGPKYTVQRTKGSHFKSLTGIFPGTLLETIANHIETQKEKKFAPPSTDDMPTPEVVGEESTRNLFFGLTNETRTTSGGLFASLGRSEGSGSTASATTPLSSNIETKSLFSGVDSSASEDVLPDHVTPGMTTGSLFTKLGEAISVEPTQPTPTNPAVTTTQRPRAASSLKTTSATSETSAAATSDMKPSIDRGSLKVLYAEDNIVNQKVLSRVLNRAGITDITVVENGQKAVDIAQTTHFDCIFMDVQMPVMDGLEACERIVARDPKAIVIFVTAHALDEFKAKAESVGGTSFISKPFRVSDIDNVLLSIGKRAK